MKCTRETPSMHSTEKEEIIMGIMLSFLTAIAFSSSHILVRKGIDQTEGKNNGFLITVIINALVLGLIFIIYAIVQKFNFHFSWPAVFFFILAGLLTTGLGRLTFFSSINLINPSRAAGIKNAAPIFTVLLA